MRRNNQIPGPVLLPFSCLCILFQGCAETNPTLTPVTIAEGSQPIAGLVYVAYYEKFFEGEGLDVTLKPYSSGKACLDAVLNGDADFGTVAETPIVLSALNGNEFYVTATIHESEENTVLIARKDHGIHVAADLNGKKIGVSRGTNAEYMLDTFLLLHNISQDSLDIVNLSPDEIVDGLTSGRVDAVCTWNPHVSELSTLLGANANIFSGKGIYTETYNLVATQRSVRDEPTVTSKVLRALVRARAFVRDNPERSQQIIAKHTGMEVSRLAELWDIYYFSVELEKPFLRMLQSQGRWAMENELTESRSLPDFSDFFYMDGLRAVDPALVTLRKQL